MCIVGQDLEQGKRINIYVQIGGGGWLIGSGEDDAIEHRPQQMETDG